MCPIGAFLRFTRALGAEVPVVALSAGPTHPKAPQLWHSTAEESTGRAGRSPGQRETAAQVAACVGTQLAAHSRSWPTQENLGAAGHRLTRNKFGARSLAS